MEFFGCDLLLVVDCLLFVVCEPYSKGGISTWQGHALHADERICEPLDVSTPLGTTTSAAFPCQNTPLRCLWLAGATCTSTLVFTHSVL